MDSLAMGGSWIYPNTIQSTSVQGRRVSGKNASRHDRRGAVVEHPATMLGRPVPGKYTVDYGRGAEIDIQSAASVCGVSGESAVGNGC